MPRYCFFSFIYLRRWFNTSEKMYSQFSRYYFIMTLSQNKTIQYLDDNHDLNGSIFVDSDADHDFNPYGRQSTSSHRVS